MSVDVLAPILERLAKFAANKVTIGISATEGWTDSMLDRLTRSGIVSCEEYSRGTICPGCTRSCMMDVKFIDFAGQPELSAYVVCDKPEDCGLIEIDQGPLQQWSCSRSGLVKFLATELGLRAKDSGRVLDRISFGTSRRLRRAIAIEFTETVRFVIGDDRHDLADLLIWDRTRVRLDWELLQALANRTQETFSGRKRYQRTTTKRENGKKRTELRDLRLQAAVDSVQLQHPTWNKERSAKEVAKSSELRNVSWQRIMRVTRVRK